MLAPPIASEQSTEPASRTPSEASPAHAAHTVQRSSYSPRLREPPLPPGSLTPSQFWRRAQMSRNEPGAQRFQRSPVALSPSRCFAIQAKLRVGAVDDPLEHEADRVADQVMRAPAPSASVAATPPLISRKCASCDEEELQKKAAGPEGGGEAPSIVHDVLHSPGQPLDAATRAFMEPAFSHNLSTVRVHADTKPSESASSVNALAYAAGNHIVFGAGQYVPSSRSGRRLIAHELAHVLQQSGSEPAIRRAPAQTNNLQDTSKKDRGHKDVVIQVTWSKDIGEFKHRLLLALHETSDFSEVAAHTIEEAFSVSGFADAFHQKFFDTFKQGQRVHIRVTASYDPKRIGQLWNITINNWEENSPVKEQAEEDSVRKQIAQAAVAADQAGWAGLTFMVFSNGKKLVWVKTQPTGLQQPRTASVPALSEEVASMQLRFFLERATLTNGTRTGYFTRDPRTGGMRIENEALHKGMPEAAYNKIEEIRKLEKAIAILKVDAKDLEHQINDANEEWKNTSSWITGSMHTHGVDYLERMSNSDLSHVFQLLGKATSAVHAHNVPLARAMIAYCDRELLGLNMRFEAFEHDVEVNRSNMIRTAGKVEGASRWAVSHLASKALGPGAGQIVDHLYGGVLEAASSISMHAHGLTPAPVDPSAPIDLPLPDLDPSGGLPQLASNTPGPQSNATGGGSTFDPDNVQGVKTSSGGGTAADDSTTVPDTVPHASPAGAVPADPNPPSGNFDPPSGGTPRSGGPGGPRKDVRGEVVVDSDEDFRRIRGADEVQDAQNVTDTAQGNTPKINKGKQDKHIVGTNNFVKGRSELTADPHELAKSAGTGSPVGSTKRGSPGFKERVDFGKVIGIYIDEDSAVRLPTTKGIITYDNKGGIHIIPARP
jgi:Domain of unknown function (DUF4157)/Bacterial toxin 50